MISTDKLIHASVGLIFCSLPLLANGFVSYAPSARAAFMYRYQTEIFYAGLFLIGASSTICLLASIRRHKKKSLNDASVAIGYNASLVSFLIVTGIAWLILAT